MKQISKIFKLSGDDGMEKLGYKYFVMPNANGGFYVKNLDEINKQKGK